MEQAVIVYLPLIEDPFGSARECEAVVALADLLHRVIDQQGVGELGHAVDARSIMPRLTRVRWKRRFRSEEDAK